VHIVPILPQCAIHFWFYVHSAVGLRGANGAGSDKGLLSTDGSGGSGGTGCKIGAATKGSRSSLIRFCNNVSITGGADTSMTFSMSWW
jgi:hypothetical protein